jgi:hypothetical protein
VIFYRRERGTEGGAAANGAPIDAARPPQPVSELPVEVPTLDLAEIRREARRCRRQWQAALAPTRR